ncbi:DUF3455 domain-containing protein [Chitinimonas naiadis]
MKTFATLTLSATGLMLLSACAGMSGPGTPARPYSQDALPDAVKVPAGNLVALETTGIGEITYECRAKANMAGAFEWTFVGPQADLKNRGGTRIGTYYGPPATWASLDGSKVTGTQLAVAPAGTGNIPAQLVKANPATGTGAMAGITFIQRVATQGGVAPASPCDQMAAGRKEVVKYQADYIFWKAA